MIRRHPMGPFDHQPRTRIVFGAGRLSELGSLALELGALRALVVSDPGIVAVGHAGRGIAALESAGLATLLFDGVAENPTTDCVEAGLAAARDFKPDLLVGLGGGSSMDCAKGINFLFTNGGTMKDYWGVGKATAPMLPTIAVPTTAGTGSETQSYALISDPRTHAKMACGDPKAACRIALLDPELTLSMPEDVTAVTGIDAISHAVESFVCNRANAISRMFSRRAWALLAPNFPVVFDRPDDIEARGAMLLGASMAGLAIENSMLGAAHACANPLTARYDITHGRAIALMLPHVVRRNATDAATDRLYGELLADLGPFGVGGGSAGERLADRLDALIAGARLPGSLAECGVERDSLSAMAREAAAQWTANFNPIKLSEADFVSLYGDAFAPVEDADAGVEAGRLR